MTPDHKLFDKWCRGGDKALNQDEWNQVRNAMSGNPAVDPENGGYTVPTTVATTLLDDLKAYGGMRQVATIFRLARGAPMQFPTSAGTSDEGAIGDENPQ